MVFLGGMAVSYERGTLVLGARALLLVSAVSCLVQSQVYQTRERDLGGTGIPCSYDPPPPRDHHRSFSMGVLQSPTGGGFV